MRAQRQYPPEYYEPSSRGPCQVCKVDEEDHGHVWRPLYMGGPCAFHWELREADHDDHEYEPCEPVRDDA